MYIYQGHVPLVIHSLSFYIISTSRRTSSPLSRVPWVSSLVTLFIIGYGPRLKKTVNEKIIEDPVKTDRVW